MAGKPVALRDQFRRQLQQGGEHPLFREKGLKYADIRHG
jgi:hypothetical protein